MFILPKKINFRKIKKSPTGPENSANVINQVSFSEVPGLERFKKKKNLLKKFVKFIYLFSWFFGPGFFIFLNMSPGNRSSHCNHNLNGES